MQLCFTEAKCVADKVKPPEEIGVTLPHKTFAVSHILEIFMIAKGEMRRQ